uniref:Uncharacterized protein n=1 Tax=Populus trichocarpa TaxID=3694 RepID=A9P892_POPTR|nr:unknown [Populus trichocarpa]
MPIIPCEQLFEDRIIFLFIFPESCYMYSFLSSF